MKVAFGQSVYSSRIKTENVTLDQLFKRLKKPYIRDKKDGPYFIFSSFTSNKRNAQTLDKTYGATIDIEKGELTLEKIQKAFSQYRHFIYTTYSHKAPGEGERYRLVLPYKEPLTVEQHREYLWYIFRRLGTDNIDLSTDTISRPMYLPACPSKRKRYFKYLQKTTGKLFSIEFTPQMRFEMQEYLDNENSNEKFNINGEVEAGNRNNALSQLVGKFIHSGMDMPTILKASMLWNETNCDPPLEEADVETIVNSIYKTHKRNNKDGGWGYDEVLRRVTESKNSEHDFDILTQLIATAQCKTSEREILTRKLAKFAKLPIGVVREEVKSKQLRNDEISDEEDTQDNQRTAKSLRNEFRDWVYIGADDRVYNFNKALQFKPEGFNKTFQPLVEKGAILNLLLKYKCIRTADTKQYHPGEKEIYRDNYRTFANTYKPPDVIPQEGSVGPMLSHLRYIIPNDQERNIFLDWIAFIMQNPGKKCMWMPVIKGSKGIGKSMIAEFILTPMLGEENVTPVEPKKVAADFNSWKLDTQLVVFNELRLGNTRNDKELMTEMLKEVITDSRMLAAKKGVDDFMVGNRLNLFGLTNHDDAILITIDERRFFMVRSPATKRPREYYTAMVEWFEQHTGEMFNYFLERDIVDFNFQDAPESEYTKQVKLQSLMWPSSVIVEALTDSKHIFNQPFTTWRNIVEYVRHESTGRDAIIADQLIKPTSSVAYRLTNALADIGFRKWISPGGNSRLRIAKQLETIFATPTNLSPETYTNKFIKDLLTKQKSIWDFDQV